LSVLSLELRKTQDEATIHETTRIKQK